MKNLFLFLSIVLFLTACNESGGGDGSKTLPITSPDLPVACDESKNDHSCLNPLQVPIPTEEVCQKLADWAGQDEVWYYRHMDWTDHYYRLNSQGIYRVEVDVDGNHNDVFETNVNVYTYYCVFHIIDSSQGPDPIEYDNTVL